jgi:hypothetical protein
MAWPSIYKLRAIASQDANHEASIIGASQLHRARSRLTVVASGEISGMPGEERSVA